MMSLTFASRGGSPLVPHFPGLAAPGGRPRFLLPRTGSEGRENGRVGRERKWECGRREGDWEGGRREGDWEGGRREGEWEDGRSEGEGGEKEEVGRVMVDSCNDA